MKTIRKHHSEHLDGTKGAWRPALIAGLIGVDGHPASFNEIVVITCPACGAPQGIGGDDVKIVDGKTDKPWICYDARCRHSETLEFEGHQEPHGRMHFADLKDQALKSVSKARMDAIHGKVKENLLKELDARAHAEAKKILPEGDPNHAELFKKVMDPNNNDAFKKAIDRYLNGEDK